MCFVSPFLFIIRGFYRFFLKVSLISRNRDRKRSGSCSRRSHGDGTDREANLKIGTEADAALARAPAFYEINIVLGHLPRDVVLHSVHHDGIHLDQFNHVPSRYHSRQRAGGTDRHHDRQPHTDSQQNGEQELHGETSRGYRDSWMHSCYLQRQNGNAHPK